ncbi:ABC transporter substrate-binding protein [Candidatus Bathyarchaeota archaeon]|nr:ABC transporter substrate-binding protein [Candidatus Bathyarchaeota archaeon]
MDKLRNNLNNPADDQHEEGKFNKIYKRKERVGEIMADRRLLIAGTIVVLIIVVGAYVLWPRPAAPPPEGVPKYRVLRSTWAFPTYIDPAVGTDRSSSCAQINLYDPLIKLGPGGVIIPWIATNWTYSEDGLTWNFTIRQGVLFHDGTELTAEDVAFSINRMLRMGTGRAYVLEPYVYPNVTVVGDNIVQFHLKVPFGPLVSALNGWYILNKDLVMQHIESGEYGDWGDYGKEWLTTHDAGSGPYKVKSFVLEEKLVMEKFEDYWAGFVDKAPDIVEMIGTTEPITVRTMLANGELEYSDCWQSLENLLAIKEIPNITISARADTTGGWQLMINTKKPPCDDVHFRRAMAYCLNYTKMVTDIFPGTVQMVGPVNTAMLGHNPDVLQFHQNFDKAREELALSKYADNYTEYEVELHWCAEVPDEEKLAMQFMTDCAVVNIDIKVVKTPWTTMVQETGSLETSPHMVYISAGGAYPEAGSMLMSRYHSSNAASWMQNEWLLNETLDAMMEDAVSTLNFNERLEKYKAIQVEIVNLCPTIWLYQGIYWHAYPNYVTPPWVVNGTYVKTAILGDVYIYTPQSGGDFECRLYRVDREIEYGG